MRQRRGSRQLKEDGEPISVRRPMMRGKGQLRNRKCKRVRGLLRSVAISVRPTDRAPCQIRTRKRGEIISGIAP